ncbi:MAG: hypothetical protein AB4426_13310 [Xenococcaceae cyanobacterium]
MSQSTNEDYPTNKDWGNIHAKAWCDSDFRKLLEEDPTQALAQYGNEVGKTFTKRVKLPERPKDVKEEDLHLLPDFQYPVACC